MKKQVKVKTQKIIGKQNYINQQTGEIVEMSVIERKITQDTNWHKVWIQDLMGILDLVGGKKLTILKFLINNMRESDNTINVTYKQITEKLGISSRTIAETMKILQESNFLKKLGHGYWMINPDIIAKGNSNKRNALLIKYVFENEIDKK